MPVTKLYNESLLSYRISLIMNYRKKKQNHKDRAMKNVYSVKVEKSLFEMFAELVALILFGELMNLIVEDMEVNSEQSYQF